VKEESKTIYYGFTLSLKNITKINLTKRKSTILDQKIIFNSESKKRVNQFIKNVYNDFSLLETDEEKGRYLLKVITFTTIFTLIYSPNPGKLTSFSKTPKIKSLLRKSLFPIFMMSSSLVVANRILEQVEKKISDNDEVIQLSEEVRNFITTINAGLNSGLTVQSIAEAFLQSNIRPKEKVDHLVHSALVGLFSKDKA